MKKHLFILLGIVLFSLSVSAQTAIGLKAGLNGSEINNSTNDLSSVLRTNLGLVCNFGYTKPVSFQMEANYSRKGGKMANDNRLTYGYVEIPLLLKISGGNKELKIFGLGGPYIAAPIKEEYIVNGVETSTTTTDDGYDNNPVIEKIDVGFQIGGGITYKLGPGRVLLEVRYCQGIGASFLDDTFNSTVFQVNTGYLFTFGD